ncbi:unnamed protein product [Penicillium salamii]|uniref:Uncharacterized protein n=1 Tax=Penicillium salamii TaxID=1612424 RepID=A0A9W4NJY0_9EURO|nr:unnamed protein product [Penicillium salamii]CAG7980622.1 unnamed protein product [Penicillium salamii]CAG8078413.1 unnamed protein product [Penicillium salamii]CAG8081943.1 unnamed protein product [Penicillium salamii]CAG8238225.1 unnamed protein product [Penicillium salamii]
MSDNSISPLEHTPKYECSICLKRYKRREHLFRHISSHTSQRPHQCTSCNGSFQRADVLKRHMRTCDGGSSRAANRRRACDRCVRQKKACSSHQPCHSCAKKGSQCWYPTDAGSSSRSQRGSVDEETPRNAEINPSTLGLTPPPANPMMPWGFTSDELQALGTSPQESFFGTAPTQYFQPEWQDAASLASETMAIFEPSASNEDSRQSLRFLDKFTSNTGLVSSFDCGTQEQREKLSAELDRQISLQLQHRIIDTSSTDEFPLDWFNDPLSLKTHEILLLIEEVVTIKPRNSSVTLEWSPALRSACLQFFSPSNLRRFLGFYWAIWHPNVNFVHRPTFDPLAAKPTVLAAMALIGACVSSDMPENEDAKTWFNCVEEMVFIDDDFNSDMTYPPCGSMATQRRKIQALQAAYIVCLYQNWEGTDASKSRIRRYRFGTLVSTARDIGITSARHLNYSEQGRHDFEWKEYAAREELIRVFSWIYLLDSAFVIFNNLPPRMLIKEMRLHMATPEACFQATTADQCHEQIQTSLPARSLYWSISFRGAFESLCKDDPSTDIHGLVATLCPLNLFALTSAIHSQIFQFRSVVGSFQLLAPIRNALSNWRAIWQSFSSNFPQGLSPHMTIEDPHIQPGELWTRMGFCRYAPEYWLLAQLMADRLAVLETSQQVNELEPLEEGPLDPILNKYDQTSMRQVNDLIMGFQTFQI